MNLNTNRAHSSDLRRNSGCGAAHLVRNVFRQPSQLFRGRSRHRCTDPAAMARPGRCVRITEETMRVGSHLPHIGRKAGPEAIRRAAVQAEELGFADAWTSEHIIIPKAAPYPPSAIFYDPVLTLTWAAAFTKRIGLGTSVLVLPMRHPLPLAKELATLQ